MNQQFQPRRARPAAHGRMKEQHHEDYEGDADEQQLSLDQLAGAAARGIIKQTGVEDTTQIWRALKRAYLTGYADATR